MAKTSPEYKTGLYKDKLPEELTTYDITDGVDRAADDLTEDNGPRKDAEDSDGDNSGNDGDKTGRENSGR